MPKKVAARKFAQARRQDTPQRRQVLRIDGFARKGTEGSLDEVQSGSPLAARSFQDFGDISFI